jgi:hypothetical protein
LPASCRYTRTRGLGVDDTGLSLVWGFTARIVCMLSVSGDRVNSLAIRVNIPRTNEEEEEDDDDDDDDDERLGE